MKITRIELKGCNQFKDVVIDLTYPKGHEKEGKPLDKVCFTGQSGSGKTSLLRYIKWFVALNRDVGKHIELPVPPLNSVKMDFQVFDLAFRMYTVEEFPYLFYQLDNKTDQEAFFKLLDTYLRGINPLLVNFPTEILIDTTPPAKKDTLDELEKIKASMAYPASLRPRLTIDFAFADVSKNWEYILKDIKKHRAQELFMKNKIGEIASKKDAGVEEIEREKKEYEIWAAQNPDPLKVLAGECLDPMLFNLGLKTKRDIDIETILNLGFIELQTLAGQDVPYNFWSTGTRQLVQTVIPLFQLKPGNAVILIDEPERSLYPDVQISIIDDYVKLAPGCQFFFATHSPIIAAFFEPWEIVELKFDKGHTHVYRDLHYEGENHVDNYKYFPEYMRWDSILERIFELEEEGGKRRLGALEKLAEVKSRLKKLKEKGKLDTPEGKTLAEEFKALGQKVDWDF